jgi:4-carboxymuconolactone decarboxylase
VRFRSGRTWVLFIRWAGCHTSRPERRRKSTRCTPKSPAWGRIVANLYKMLANQPPALAAFLGMSRYIRSASSLDPGLRELSILATAHEFCQEYELAHHTDAATRAGVPQAKLEALRPGGNLNVLTPAERCAVEFARQVAQRRDCDDATFARLQEHFTSEGMIDLVVTAAWYHPCAVILGTTRVEVEAQYGGSDLT